MSLYTADESLFWYWITERHSIFLRRQRGEPKPWTDDPIFQTYKFTNVFRELDTGTIWLRKNFLEPHRDDDLGLIAFNICFYRMFNWKGTGELLGWQTNWEADRIKYELDCQLMDRQQVFTGAHIVRSAFNMPKVDSIVDVCTDLYDMCMDPTVHHKTTWQPLPVIARTYRKLETVYNLLLLVDYVGPFMAYEMVTDMRHTRLLEDATDIWTWANAGPGAIRGLQRLGLPATPPSEALKSMQGLLARGNDRYYHPGVDIPIEPRVPVDYPRFEMRDIEHSLCEFDKYCRVKFGEGRPRGRYNGK